MKQKIVNEKTGLITKLSLFFIERYRITVLLLIGTLVFGFLAYTTFLKREGFPPINTPFAIVQTPYFVNNKDKVDTDITKPIINTIQDIDEIKSLSSNSSENFSSVNVRFEDTITSEAGSKIVCLSTCYTVTGHI